MRASAVEKFAQKFVRPAAGRTLIVGSRLYGDKPDRRKLYREAVGVDMLAGPGVDIVRDLEAPGAADELGRFVHIECLSVLEHSRRPWLLAEQLEELLEPAGTLHLQVPFVWRYHDYPGDLWRFTHEAVPVLFPRIRWIAVNYASDKLRGDTFIRGVTPVAGSGHPYFPRTEVCGFGVRLA